MLTPADAWAAYEAAADSNSLLTDILTCASINTISDSVAQSLERSLPNNAVAEQDAQRTANFALFGLADGAVSHVWFEALDAVVGEDGTLMETLLKSAGDALVYTPLWCAWFLAAFVVLERRDVRTIPRVVSSEWLELFSGNLGFFLPLTFGIYGFVPRDERVLAFGVASLVYTTILSLWNSGRGAEEEVELCRVDGDADGACEALPRPPRSSVPFGVRRVLVRARSVVPAAKLKGGE